MEADVEALFKFTEKKGGSLHDGYRPAHMIKKGYLTTGVHHYHNLFPDVYELKGTICFLSPEKYPACLWVGKKIEMFDGGTMIGTAEILEIYNPILKIQNGLGPYEEI